MQKLEQKQFKISANTAKIIPKSLHFVAKKEGLNEKWMLRMLITVLNASLSIPSLRLSSVKGFHKSSDSWTTEEAALQQLRMALQLQSKHRCDPWERKSIKMHGVSNWHCYTFPLSCSKLQHSMEKVARLFTTIPHGIACVQMDLESHLVPAPYHGQSCHPPHQAAQGPIQPSLEQLLR